jgi:spermidine synthase
MAADTPNLPSAERGRRPVLWALAGLGMAAVMTQLALMRELLGAFAGNEMVLGIALGLWLLLTGLGTSLGRTADKLRNPLAVLFAAQIFIAVIPLAQVFAVRALRNVVFIRGAEVGVVGTVLSTAVLLLPFCLVAGYTLTLACSILNRSGDASGAGRVYVADSLGSVVGGALFSFVLVRFLDHIALLAVPALLNLAAAAWIGRSRRRESALTFPESKERGLTSAAASLRWEIFIVALAAGIFAFVWLVHADALSTSLQFPGQNVLFHANSPYGRLVVTESEGETNFIENGLAVVSTPNVTQVEEAAHYAMSQRPDARRVLLVSGGVAGVTAEILKYPVTGVDCVELDPLVIETGRRFLPGNFADPRTRVITADARQFVRQTTNRYDVVILALPDPSTAQLNRFFTVEFFNEVKRVLTTGGVFSFALGRYENYVSPELARLLASAQRSLQQSFANRLVLPGDRVFFLASDGPLFENIAARVEARGIPTKLVNRHYLDAMLAADRMADIQRAVSQPAALNRDFSPMLYYYHLRHWMSQFSLSFGVLQAVLLLLLLVYLVRLRGPALVLFASGFAGSALEVVLLLAFQILCGSVYHQVGVIVTVFMAGLTLGAMWMNRRSKAWGNGVMGCCNKTVHAPVPVLQHSDTPIAMDLAFFAFAIAGWAILLPFLLPLLNRLGGTEVSFTAIKAIITLLTLILAVLVGAQFPLANRLVFDGTTTGAARLYTADFVGASLGALLASTLLIPLMGVLGVCLLTAALNVLAGGVLFWRKVSL